jgi:uncharacterized protein involved in outer membrane biogenesis
MRKLGIAIGVFFVVIISGMAIFVATFDVTRYRGTIQSALEKRIGRNVNLGKMHLSILPPRFVVDNTTITDDPKLNTERPFVHVQQLGVSLKLWPLLQKSVEIDSLYLQRPVVELIKNPAGKWNFSTLGSGPSSSGQVRFSLSEMVIQDGQVAITDFEARKPRSVYDHIDVLLRDFAPGRPFSVNAAVHLPGPGDQEVRLQGKGGPIPQDQPAATPFQGTLDLQRVGLSSVWQFVNSPALAKMNGTLSGQTKISSESGKLSAEGNLNIQNGQINGQNLGYPIAAQYKIRDDVPADLLSIDNATVQLGNTPLLINGTMNSKPTPAQINMKLKATSVSIAEAAKLAAASGAAFTPGATVTGTVDADIDARGAADKPALNGTITGRDIHVSGQDVPQPVQVRTLALALTPTEIRSDNFNVTSGGTSLGVQFALRQYLSNMATIDATVRAPNAELPAVLSMAKAYGITALDKVNGSGTLALDLHATGPLQAIASADLGRALNGAVGLKFQNVHYTGADISHELASIAGMLGIHEANQGATTINRLTGNIAIKNGTARTNDLQALLDIGNLGIAGTADLVSQALNLRVTAVLSKEFSQKVGGTSIGGYTRTALANKQGELVIPADVKGTFQHPQFAPDLQQVAQMKLKGLVPDFNNPSAAVSELVGDLLGRQGGTQAQPQQGTPPKNAPSQNPLQQLQDIFGRKKKQQPEK